MKTPIAVSSWSVHRKLGYAFANGPGHREPFQKSDTWGAGAFGILELPAELKAQGYNRCELCHFHIGSHADVELAEIRAAFENSGVFIQTLLIDDGDITNPATREADLSWIEKWIETAAKLGAENARVVAGKALPNDQSLSLSVDGLRRMVAVGQSLGVNIVTENWFDLLSTPEAVDHVLDHVKGLGFLADTGNWSGPNKYHDLEKIFRRASLCHAKAIFGADLKLDADDFGACLAAASRASYAGPLTLIFADDGDEWAGLDVERRFAISAASDGVS